MKHKNPRGYWTDERRESLAKAIEDGISHERLAAQHNTSQGNIRTQYYDWNKKQPGQRSTPVRAVKGRPAKKKQKDGHGTLKNGLVVPLQQVIDFVRRDFQPLAVIDEKLIFDHREVDPDELVDIANRRRRKLGLPSYQLQEGA
jgi:hypothetical protein